MSNLKSQRAEKKKTSVPKKTVELNNVKLARDISIKLVLLT